MLNTYHMDSYEHSLDQINLIERSKFTCSWSSELLATGIDFKNLQFCSWTLQHTVSSVAWTRPSLPSKKKLSSKEQTSTMRYTNNKSENGNDYNNQEKETQEKSTNTPLTNQTKANSWSMAGGAAPAILGTLGLMGHGPYGQATPWPGHGHESWATTHRQRAMNH